MLQRQNATARWLAHLTPHCFANGHCPSTTPRQQESLVGTPTLGFTTRPPRRLTLVPSVTVHNAAAMTEKASLDLFADETTCPFVGFGPGDGSGLVARQQKKMCAKGGQIVLCADADRIHPRAHLHWHKLHKFNWSDTGASEVELALEQLGLLVHVAQDETNDPEAHVNRPKPIISCKEPHVTRDDHFSGDEIMLFAAETGVGLTMTCQRGRLPKGIPLKHWHKISAPVQTPCARAAQWEHPAVAIKHHAGSTLQCVSFQSTSSCDIVSINTFNGVSLFTQTKSRGQKDNKQQWGIEMSEARHLHLNTHGKMDSIDHFLDNCDMFHKCVINEMVQCNFNVFSLHCFAGPGNIDIRQ